MPQPAPERPPEIDDGRWRCGNASRGGLLATEVRLLDNRWARLRQAAGRRLRAGQGLWLQPALAVHAFFAGGPLLVVFVDPGWRALEVAMLPRGRARPAPKGACAALILPAGTSEPPRPGDRLELLRTQPRAPDRARHAAPAAEDPPGAGLS